MECGGGLDAVEKAWRIPDVLSLQPAVPLGSSRKVSPDVKCCTVTSKSLPAELEEIDF